MDYDLEEDNYDMFPHPISYLPMFPELSILKESTKMKEDASKLKDLLSRVQVLIRDLRVEIEKLP